VHISRIGEVTVKLLLLYKLREGVTREEYRKWSLERDQPTLTACEGVSQYRVFDVGASDGEAAYDIVEYVEVDDWNTWRRVTTTGPMVPIGDDFQRLVDTATVITLPVEEIA
jgi:hypothetical protein